MNTQQLWLIAAGLALVSLVLGWLHMRSRAQSGSQYAPMLVMDSVAQHRYRLLQAAFPTHIVLAQVRMDTLLRVVRAADRDAAQQRTAQHIVQYAVLGVDGRAEVLFEADAGRRSTSTEKSLRKKYALAKVAGVPMVRIRSNEDISSDEFRRRVEIVIEKARERSRGVLIDPMNRANDTAMPHSIQAILPKRHKFATRMT